MRKDYKYRIVATSVSYDDAGQIEYREENATVLGQYENYAMMAKWLPVYRSQYNTWKVEAYKLKKDPWVKMED